MAVSQMNFDVVIIGGAYAGASTGLLLKRRNPAWRILILEKAEVFDRKVGESTTEVSSRFMTAVLGIAHHLGHHQLNKQGLRMWFAPQRGAGRGAGDENENENERAGAGGSPEAFSSGRSSFEACAELGARNNSRLSGFQVDRSVLDEFLLREAEEAGCEVRRPAKVLCLELEGEGRNTIRYAQGGEDYEVNASWVVDASGRAALIARKKGLFTPLTEHPVNAIWGRFKGVKDWDGYTMRQRYPGYATACNTARQWATNHLTGYGWWCWIIPLKGGDTSVGLVYDRRLYTPPEGKTLAERLTKHFKANPIGEEILGEAEAISGDVRAFSQLPYTVSRIVGEGWALVGDAAGFLDPFYSPGLDFCSYTAHHAHTVIASRLEGKESCLESANRRFAYCFRAWFEAIYRDKYYYMGDGELMRASFLLDIGSYHLGPVREVFGCSSRFSEFPFHGRPGRIVASLLAFFNRRLVFIARKKRRAGTWGDRNADWRFLIGGFLPDASSLRLFLKGVGYWLVAEARAWNLPPPIEERAQPIRTPMPGSTKAAGEPEEVADRGS